MQEWLDRFERRVNACFNRSEYPPKTAALMWFIVCCAEGLCYNYIIPLLPGLRKTAFTVFFMPVYMLSFALMFWRAADALNEDRRHRAHRLIIFVLIIVGIGGTVMFAGLSGAALYF